MSDSNFFSRPTIGFSFLTTGGSAKFALSSETGSSSSKNGGSSTFSLFSETGWTSLKTEVSSTISLFFSNISSSILSVSSSSVSDDNFSSGEFSEDGSTGGLCLRSSSSSVPSLLT